MTRFLKHCDSHGGAAFRVACLVLAIPVAAAAQEGFAPAAPFGLVGLARFQTARLNVVSLTVPSPEAPPGPCLVVLSFVDEAGEPIVGRGGQPVASEAELLPGQSTFLELSSAVALSGTVALRRQVRARVFVPDPGPPDVPPGPCAQLASTLEIIDQFTARTVLVLIPSPGPPDVQ
jgi:hypothetical protein